MADRTAAGIFGEFFDLAAGIKQTPEVKRLALLMWCMTGGYDFSPDQMECDEALIKLGLAKRGVDPDYPEDGEVVLYD